MFIYDYLIPIGGNAACAKIEYDPGEDVLALCCSAFDEVTNTYIVRRDVVERELLTFVFAPFVGATTVSFVLVVALCARSTA